MDTCEYSTLSAALADIADPRKQRGKRHAWIVILTLIAAAMTNGACSEKAIPRWVGVRREELTERLKLAHGVPSASTLQRALQTMSVETLEARLSAYMSKAEVTLAKETARRRGSPWTARTIDRRQNSPWVTPVWAFVASGEPRPA